jgi:deazaflavin-dependent oxidoreductase (nitroreductase family)
VSGKRSTGPPELHVVTAFQGVGAFHRTMRRFAATKVAAAMLRPTSQHLGRLVDKLSDGRLSFVSVAAGLPLVLLATAGAKLRKPRTVPVFGIPHVDGPAFIASNFSRAKQQGWYYNLKANPEATVAIARSAGEPPSRDLPRHANEMTSGRRALRSHRLTTSTTIALGEEQSRRSSSPCDDRYGFSCHGGGRVLAADQRGRGRDREAALTGP